MVGVFVTVGVLVRVGVFVRVGVLVLVGVLVRVSVGVEVAVAVAVGHGGCSSASCRPLERPPVWHSKLVKLPASPCMPTSASAPPANTGPYTKSIRFCPS